MLENGLEGVLEKNSIRLGSVVLGALATRIPAIGTLFLQLGLHWIEQFNWHGQLGPAIPIGLANWQFNPIQFAQFK
jgi:hypothetical protein